MVIPSEDLPDKAYQLVLVQLRDCVHIQGLEDVVSQYCWGDVSSKGFTELQCVEVKVFHCLDL